MPLDVPFPDRLADRGGPTLRGRLLLLVAAVALPLLMLAAAAVLRLHEGGRRQEEARLGATARAMAMLVDAEFARADALVRTLATTPALASGDLPAFRTQVLATAAATRCCLVLLGPDGTLAAHSNASDALPPPGLPVPEVLARAAADGRAAVSDLYDEPLSGQKVFGLAVPVRVGEGAGALGVTLAASRLTAALRGLGPGPGQVAAVVDREGRVVARTRREEALLGTLATAPVREGLARAPAGLLRDVPTQDGVPSAIAFARAPASGYAVAVAVAEETFAAPLRTSLAQILAAGAALAVAGAALALLLARRVAASLAALSRNAGETMPGTGHGEGTRSGALREVRSLAASLERAAGERERRDTQTRLLLGEKDLMMAEVHHRVKNSLQLVGNMLSLQSRNCGSPEAVTQLRSAAERVKTIAGVHRRLYEGGGSEQEGSAAVYLGTLLDELRTGVAAPGREVSLLVEADVELPSERLGTLGLVATELVTNALKHGRGRVEVTLRPLPGGGVRLRVDDQGPGFPPGFDPAAPGRSLGMRIVSTLARSRGGTVRAPGGTGRGTITVDLPGRTAQSDAAD